MVLGSDAVRGEEVDDLCRAESSIAHAGKDLVDGVGRKWNQAVRRDLRVVRTAGKELQARPATAVADTNSTRKLDAIEAKSLCIVSTKQTDDHSQVAERDLVLDGEWLLFLDDLVEAIAGVEGGLNFRECHDGSIFEGCPSESLCSTMV